MASGRRVAAERARHHGVAESSVEPERLAEQALPHEARRRMRAHRGLVLDADAEVDPVVVTPREAVSPYSTRREAVATPASSSARTMGEKKLSFLVFSSTRKANL